MERLKASTAVGALETGLVVPRLAVAEGQWDQSRSRTTRARRVDGAAHGQGHDQGWHVGGGGALTAGQGTLGCPAAPEDTS